MLDQKEYYEAEILRAKKRFTENEKIRRQERSEVFKTLDGMDTETLQERIEWLLGGNYGYGEMQIALQHVAKGKKSKRYNRNANLFVLICNLEWLSPSRVTQKFWRSLAQRKQEEINQAIDRAVDSCEEAEKCIN